MSNLNHETVLSVHHWTDTLFSFTTTRDPAFRFENGQFAMIGLEIDGKPLLRAYSMVSPNFEETLEFLSIKVPDGPLTSRLRNVKEGDTVLVGQKATGTLLLHNLLPGRILYLLGTGTGLAPFMSIIRDPRVYERFEKVVLVHGCRLVDELAYSERIREEFPRHDYFGELIAEKLLYYPTVTRQPHRNRGRITELLQSDKIGADLSIPPLDADKDRVMLCGSPQFLFDMRELMEGMGMQEGNQTKPGEYVIEKAFVER
ncbi:MAG: ferredoxin--NADP reductase [Nitratireductor sp.]|nr:ferredoxin--NADP reductase [Nitratireductor sp.]